MEKTFLIEGIIGLDIVPSQISEFLKSADNSPVKFQINSPGGFVFDAIAIHNLILQYPAEVEIEILSLCASSASFIATAGDIVSVFPDSVYMLHNAWLFSYGDHNKLRADADHIEKISNLLVNAYSNFSKKSIDEIKLLMNAETFLFGKEIVENGFAHRLIEENNVVNDSSASAIDFSRKSIQDSFARMSAVKSFSQDILSAAAFLDNTQSNSSDLNQNNLSKEPASVLNDTVNSKNPSDKSLTNAQAATTTGSTLNQEPSSVNSNQSLENAQPASAISPEVADDSFSDQSFTIALFNLFEKLSLIENRLEQQFAELVESFSSFASSLNINSEKSLASEGSFGNADKVPAGIFKESFGKYIDSNFFEYRLNALVNSKMILPAHKELILKIISVIPNSPSENSYTNNSQSPEVSLNPEKSLSEELFSLFEKLISLPSAAISKGTISSESFASQRLFGNADGLNNSNWSPHNLEKEFRLANDSSSEHSIGLEQFDLPVDPVSRKNHLAILEIMAKYNCSYISAYSIFNQLK